MSATFTIDPQGHHEYVVTVASGAETVESWFRVTPELLAQLGAGPADEERVVRRTVEYLSRHQEPADFPRIIDLEDVIATYDDYVAAMNG